MKGKPTVLHFFLLLLFAALIGASYPAIKIAEVSIPPLTLMLFRAASSAIFLLLVVGLGMRRSLAPLLENWKSFALLGILAAGFYVSISEAEELITASLGALLACLMPVATFLITTLLLHWERFSWARFVGALVAFTGVALFIGPGQILAGGSELAGMVLITAGYVAYACNLIYARSCNLDPYVTATGTMVFTTLFMALAAFAVEQPVAVRPSMDAFLAASVIGILSTGIGYLVLYYLVANAGPMFTSTFCYYMPIFAVLMSYEILHEDLDLTRVTGFAITLLGAWMVNRQWPAREPVTPQ